jgi:hypothetical protein
LARARCFDQPVLLGFSETIFVLFSPDKFD